ncbi:TetR/AcrR family transcriptional regulator [Streptacidiphilus sp. N1-10]|uniref:TetR/AcrR family transcriptional regulator n=1 Tax=Streptacidiphilus jeojiensis TaxID=3229225 RepID=A0ABV6XSX2_9ACTN
MTRTGTSEETAAAPAPRRGRPRSEAAEQAIVAAVLRLIERGYPLALLSVEGIAAEAGVGKATIYRRWPNKEELLLDVLQRIDEPEPPRHDGSVRDALVAVLEFLRQAALARRAHTSLAVLSTELRSMPELYRRYHEKVIEPRRARMRELLARGVESGEIRGDLDLDLLGDLVIGPMLSRTLLRPGAELDDPTLSATIVDTVLQGIAPPVTGSGAPPL